MGLAGASPTLAGGFALREQSAFYQGMSFAGAAAGDHLSSMFWNSVATASLEGINTSSTATLILRYGKVHVDDVDVGPNPGIPLPPGASIGGFDTAGASSGDIAPPALSGASYGAYQISDKLFIGMAISGPFGLVTKPEDSHYQGSVIARTAKLFTANANPTIAYKLTPALSVGVGAQIEWAEGTFKVATLSPAAGTTGFQGDDWAFGATAGILWQTPETSIGLGWRSQLTHTLEGTFGTQATTVPIVLANGAVVPLPIPANSIRSEVDVELPDIVTLSFRQNLSPQTRLLGTVEWTNWSRFQKLEVIASGNPISLIEANWSDGWFFSGGSWSTTGRPT